MEDVKKRDIPRLAHIVSAVMDSMMYNLGVKCMWELVVWNVPCPGHSVPSSLPVTQQKSSCGQSETASLCPHTCPQKKKSSHLHTHGGEMLKSDGLFERTQDLK